MPLSPSAAEARDDDWTVIASWHKVGHTDRQKEGRAVGAASFACSRGVSASNGLRLYGALSSSNR